MLRHGTSAVNSFTYRIASAMSSRYRFRSRDIGRLREHSIPNSRFESILQHKINLAAREHVLKKRPETHEVGEGLGRGMKTNQDVNVALARCGPVEYRAKDRDPLNTERREIGNV